MPNKKSFLKNSLAIIGGLILCSESSFAIFDSQGDLALQNKDRLIDSIIVKFNENSSLKNLSTQEKIQHLSQKLNSNLKLTKKLSNGAYVFELTDRGIYKNMSTRSLTSSSAMFKKLNLALANQLNSLNQDPDIKYADLNSYAYMQKTPNDSRYAEQWHYFEEVGGMNMPEAWDITTGNDITIAVVDTGIVDHDELADKVLPGKNFVDDDNDFDDPTDHGGRTSFHGTHVAGTIAALTDNVGGIVSGVSWGAKILPARVLGNNGSGSFAGIIEGMRWAAGLSNDNTDDGDEGDEDSKENKYLNPTPAKVLNLSLGGLGKCPQSLQETIDEINNAGAIIVVAAGNSSLPARLFTPANCNGVVTVAATNRDGKKSFYSNYGSEVVDIAAPGGDTRNGKENGILSLAGPGEFQFLQGTSMASPHIAGLVGLMLSLKDKISFDHVIKYLKKGSKETNFGVGLADARRTLQLIIDGVDIDQDEDESEDDDSSDDMDDSDDSDDLVVM